MQCRNGTGDIITQVEEVPPPHRPHSHLKMVQMTGVEGYSSMLALALHIARNTTALERMVINPVAKESSYLTPGWRAERAISWGRMMVKKYLLGRGFDDIITIL